MFLDAWLIRRGFQSLIYENSSPGFPEEVVVYAPSAPPRHLASPRSCSKFFIPVLNKDQQSTVLSREHAPGVYGASSPPVNFNYKREEPMQLEPLCFSDKAQLLVSLWFSDLREWRRLTRSVSSGSAPLADDSSCLGQRC